MRFAHFLTLTAIKPVWFGISWAVVIVIVKFVVQLQFISVRVYKLCYQYHNMIYYFATWTVHFVNICVKNQQMHQLFIKFINYVAATCFGITLPSSVRVPSALWEMLNWSSVSSILWMDGHPQYSIDCPSIEYLTEGTKNAPWVWQCNAETCSRYHTN
jgi:hypothetical protein